MTPEEVPTTITFEQAQTLIEILTNLQNYAFAGLSFLVVFIVWKFVKIIYNLLAGVVLGGL